MLSDAIKGHVETMVRPVRTRYFDPRTGEPCDSKPEPLRREKGRATAEERNAAISKRERDEKEAREISDAMRRRAGLKPDGARWPSRRAGGRNGGRPRPVVVDGRLFPSVAAAAEEVGSSAQHLGKRLRGGPCTVKGHAVRFAEGSGRM